MAYEPKPGTGSAWPGERENSADWSGSILLPDGTPCFLDIWEKTSGNGNRFLSVRVKPKRQVVEQAQRQPSQREQRHAALSADPDDNLPF
ncbi:MAG: hypothetical protein MUC59_18720 [Saprospiraceae bacterium]|nr:hypothetical protein [Saprospiraceae bacterium]